jgi:hypothetical protein
MLPDVYRSEDVTEAGVVEEGGAYLFETQRQADMHLAKGRYLECDGASKGLYPITTTVSQGRDLFYDGRFPPLQQMMRSQCGVEFL